MLTTHMLTNQAIRTVADDLDRRWISDDYFDFIVWYETDVQIYGFQLCYDKSGRERALTSQQTPRGVDFRGWEIGMPEMWRLRWFRAVAIVAALIALYAWFGYQMAPRILRSQAIKFVHQTYGRDLSIGQVRMENRQRRCPVHPVPSPRHRRH